MLGTPSSEQARELLSIFQHYHLEDSSSEVWRPGIKIMQLWLSLIEAEEVKKSAVAKLMDEVFVNYRKYGSFEWIGVALRVSYWCKTMGYADLIPDDFRHLLD